MLHERARQVDPLLVLPSSFAHGHGGCDGGDEVGEEVCPYHHDGDREPKLLCQLWSNAAGRSDHLDDGVVEAADVEGSYVVLGLARGWIRFGGRTSSVRNRAGDVSLTAVRESSAFIDAAACTIPAHLTASQHADPRSEVDASDGMTLDDEDEDALDQSHVSSARVASVLWNARRTRPIRSSLPNERGSVQGCKRVGPSCRDPFSCTAMNPRRRAAARIDEKNLHTACRAAAWEWRDGLMSMRAGWARQGNAGILNGPQRSFGAEGMRYSFEGCWWARRTFNGIILADRG